MKAHAGANLVGRITRRLPVRRWQAAYWLGKYLVPKWPFIGNLYGGRLEVHPEDAASSSAFYTGFYEREVTIWCRELLKTNPPELVIDIGANFGYYPLLFGLLSGGRVRSIAFEPEPTNFAWLSRNFGLNPGINAIAVQMAIGEQADAMVPVEIATSGRSLYARVGDAISSEGPISKVDVAATTLDHYLDEHGIESAPLVMIDVEGYETKVLEGMSRGIARKRYSSVMVEFHPFVFKDPTRELAQIVDRFTSAGYQGHRFRDHGLPTSDKQREFYNLSWHPSLLEPIDVARRSNWEHYLFTL